MQSVWQRAKAAIIAEHEEEEFEMSGEADNSMEINDDEFDP